MSGSLSTWLETQLLNLTFAGGTFAPPSGIFAALFTVMPTPDGGGTEVAGGGYTRLPVNFSQAAGSPPTMSNTDALQWATASAPWGTLLGGGLYDAPTFGNFLGAARLVSAVDGITPAQIAVNAGMIFRLPAMGVVVGFVIPPATPVPFAGPPRRSLVMQPIPGEVIDAAGVGRMGLVMAPGP